MEFVYGSQVRPLDFHPNAIRVPYAHSNNDSDEVKYPASWCAGKPAQLVGAKS